MIDSAFVQSSDLLGPVVKALPTTNTFKKSIFFPYRLRRLITLEESINPVDCSHKFMTAGHETRRGHKLQPTSQNNVSTTPRIPPTRKVWAAMDISDLPGRVHYTQVVSTLFPSAVQVVVTLYFWWEVSTKRRRDTTENKETRIMEQRRNQKQRWVVFLRTSGALPGAHLIIV